MHECSVVKRLDGVNMFVSTNASPLFSDNGELQGALMTCEDITDRRRLENARIDLVVVRKVPARPQP